MEKYYWSPQNTKYFFVTCNNIPFSNLTMAILISFNYRSSTKVLLLNSFASFCIIFVHTLVHAFFLNIASHIIITLTIANCDRNSFCLNRQKEVTIIAIAIVGRVRTVKRVIKQRCKENWYQFFLKKFNSHNCTWINRKKTNISIAIFEKWTSIG